MMGNDFQIRDSFQFELKSEFFIHPAAGKNVYKQEFYLFIPNSLQINELTYTKEQFFSDQTNFVRYKIPHTTLIELVDLTNLASPFVRLASLLSHAPLIDLPSASDELKLFGDMFKGAIKDTSEALINALGQLDPEDDSFTKMVEEFCVEVSTVAGEYRQIIPSLEVLLSKLHIEIQAQYVNEFISHYIEKCFVQLLKAIRLEGEDAYPEADRLISQLLDHEIAYRKENHLSPKRRKNNEIFNEAILHRKELLNNFMLEALLLRSEEYSLEEKHGNLLGAFAAAIAMFAYMVLLVWRTSDFVINSFPFILFAVFFYVLKDRLKEWVKKIYFKQAWRWFPDYSTIIRSPRGATIGKLAENFTFIKHSRLPPGFLEIRKHQFHEELPDLARHESIIQYKRELTLYKIKGKEESRRKELTTFFLLNIHRYLLKAQDSFQGELQFEPYSNEIVERQLPKVYHLNLIIRDLYLKPDGTAKSDISLYRVVVNREGIKRLEKLIPPTVPQDANDQATS